jgi:predicted amidophosphoribosyltransferase
MRDRHFPRLCRTCDAPMARQADTCWHCGAQWVDKHETTGNSPAAPVAADDARASRVAALAGAGAAD